MTDVSYVNEPASPTDYLPKVAEQPTAAPSPAGFSEAVLALIDFIGGRGFIFEPWQIAAFVTAVRTKPFVILAGISGTGKSKLASLIAQGTGSELTLVPVRPDWTDSSDLLGYYRIN